MKFSSVLLVAGAALVAAQDLSKLAGCAKECASQLLGNTDCGIDPKCICSNKDFLTEIAACVAKDCTSESDRESTIAFAVEICAAVNIDIDTNLPPTSTSTTAAPDSTTTTPTTTTEDSKPSTTPTGNAGGNNGTIAPPKPTDKDDADSSAGMVRGSLVGVVGALAAAVYLL